MEKLWNDGSGDKLTATYTETEATFTSDENEGIDREMDVTFRAGIVTEVRTVKQEGIREIFNPLDGFSLFDGGTFNVLKPSPYTEIEYIESDGTKYIDTGFTANQNTRVILDFEMQDRSTSSGIIGCKFDYSRMFSLRVTSSGNTFTTDYGSSYAKNININANGRFLVDKNKGNVTVDGSLKIQQTSDDFTTLSPILIFAMYSSGGKLYGCLGKIYSCKIYDNDVLVRDYIPVTWNSGEHGMYDKVNNTFTQLSSI